MSFTCPIWSGWHKLLEHSNFEKTTNRTSRKRHVLSMWFIPSHSNDIVSWEDMVNHYCMWIIGHHHCSELFYTNKMTHTIELSIKSCSLGPELHPSLDPSPAPGCCLQSTETLLNKGMKYWNSALNAQGGARTFIATVHL
jgi:hypothetical protein